VQNPIFLLSLPSADCNRGGRRKRVAEPSQIQVAARAALWPVPAENSIHWPKGQDQLG